MPASTQCVRTFTGRCSGRSDPQLRAGQRTMPRVLPNERLLPTPFKNVSTNLYVSKLKLPSSVRPQTTRASRPRIFACHTHLPPRLYGARPPLKTNRKEVATFSSKRSHQKGAPNTGTQQSTSSTPCKGGGVPRPRSVHADWGCPTTDPPNGVCTLVVAALCSSVCIAVCCCAFDFEFWNLNESADTPS